MASCNRLLQPALFPRTISSPALRGSAGLHKIHPSHMWRGRPCHRLLSIRSSFERFSEYPVAISIRCTCHSQRRRPILIDRTMFDLPRNASSSWCILLRQPNCSWTASKIERRIGCPKDIRLSSSLLVMNHISKTYHWSHK